MGTDRKGRRHGPALRKDVILSVDGIDFKLPPLSSSETARRYGAVFQKLADSCGSLQTTTDATALAAIGGVSAALAEAKDVLHDILHASAVADGMIDFEQDGEAKFEEWFDGLPFLPTLGLLMSKCLEWTEAQQPLAIAYRETAKRSWAN
jgi:hypothetical protein